MDHVAVTLFGHRGCPGTERARRFFLERHIPFHEKDIADPLTREEWILQGAWATPLIIVGGTRMIGFDADRLESLLPEGGDDIAHGRG